MVHFTPPWFPVKFVKPIWMGNVIFFLSDKLDGDCGSSTLGLGLISL